jgi:ABC-type branched-subunit amino acid transport system substrate-binding protein
VIKRRRALALQGAACVVAALAVAGCSQTSASTKANLTVNGGTLSIVVSVPPDLTADPAAQDVVHAEQLAFAADQSKVKDFKLVLLRGNARTVSDSARAAIQTDSAIAYIGEIAPGDSDQTVGITNALDLLQISPTDTAAELTEKTSASEDLYQSWSVFGRTFARLSPNSVQEAKAQVAEMKSLRLRSVYVTSDGTDYGNTIAAAVRVDAKGAGIALSTGMSGSGAIFYGVESPAAGAEFFTHAASVAPKAKLFGPSSLNSGLFTSALSSSVHNLYVTVPGFMPSQLDPAGKAFDSAFAAKYGHKPNVEAVFGYAAMASLLAVLHGAGEGANNRTTVVHDFLRQSQSQSVLGAFKIDSTGNSSVDAFVIARLSGGALVPFKAAPAQG